MRGLMCRVHALLAQPESPSLA
jgi:hypothetical protein